LAFIIHNSMSLVQNSDVLYTFAMLRLRLPNQQEVSVPKQMLVGRGEDCDLVLSDPSVSSRHALLESESGKLFVTDLGSTNGTFLSDQAVSTRTEVGAGMVLRFGTLEVAVLGIVPSPIQPAMAQKPAVAGRTVALDRAAPIALCLPNGSEVALFDGISLGRDPSNTIAFAGDSKTSSNHARLEVRGQEFWLHDLQSRNGIWVNGKKIKQAVRINHNDTIVIGAQTLRVREAGAALSSPHSRPQTTGFWATLLVVGLLGAGLWAWTQNLFEQNRQDLLQAQARAKAAEEATQKAISATQNQLEQSRQAIAQAEARAREAQAAANKAAEEAAKKAANSAGRNLEAESRAKQASVLVLSQYGSGSGTLISAKGLVLTNHHVVAEGSSLANAVEIRLNLKDPEAKPDSRFPATVLKADAELDAALLQIQSDRTWVFVPLGDSDKLRSGLELAVIGFPGVGGTTQTFTRGNVAGFESDLGLERGWIKTDANISPGNSGGTAINAAGDLIGVPTGVQVEQRTLGRIGKIRPINALKTFIGR
jgi:pSer/pThr/pTyr-binding forkhead associated (FHA) protein/S1-C subfamily serine protease